MNHNNYFKADSFWFGMINSEDYEIVGSHYHRRCHPETCTCPTKLVIRHKEKHYIVGQVGSREEGIKLVAIMDFFGKEKVTRTDLIDYVYNHIS